MSILVASHNHNKPRATSDEILTLRILQLQRMDGRRPGCEHTHGAEANSTCEVVGLPQAVSCPLDGVPATTELIKAMRGRRCLSVRPASIVSLCLRRAEIGAVLCEKRICEQCHQDPEEEDEIVVGQPYQWRQGSGIFPCHNAPDTR